ncbi:MAG: ribosomal-processing cysteine protease Prp [Synergistaceae bacterium]|jgi:uncharacterized protein YsxB (DUF464 family)|nr:ribosomal-processing cysteine protease Prp [Synergistaceae bacterium]
MIEITAKRNGEGICSITAEGHSGFAESGADIICASVSSLIQALSVGLEDVLEMRGVRTVRRPEVPLMGFEWDDGTAEAQHIALTIAGSLRAVAESYPDYVAYRELDLEGQNRQGGEV